MATHAKNNNLSPVSSFLSDANTRGYKGMAHPYANVLWKTERNIATSQQRLFRSEPFMVGSLHWCLVLYPHGSGDENYIGVFIEKRVEAAPMIRFHLILENTEPAKNFLVSSPDVRMEKRDWGWHRFAPRAVVFDSKRGYYANEQLSIRLQLQVICSPPKALTSDGSSNAKSSNGETTNQQSGAALPVRHWISQPIPRDTPPSDCVIALVESSDVNTGSQSDVINSNDNDKDNDEVMVDAGSKTDSKSSTNHNENKNRVIARYNVHKSVISTASPYLAQVLSTKESNSEEVLIELPTSDFGDNKDVLDTIITIVYGGVIRSELSPAMVLAIARTASRLEITQLVDQCVEWFFDSFALNQPENYSLIGYVLTAIDTESDAAQLISLHRKMIRIVVDNSQTMLLGVLSSRNDVKESSTALLSMLPLKVMTEILQFNLIPLTESEILRVALIYAKLTGESEVISRFETLATSVIDWSQLSPSDLRNVLTTSDDDHIKRLGQPFLVHILCNLDNNNGRNETRSQKRITALYRQHRIKLQIEN